MDTALYVIVLVAAPTRTFIYHLHASQLLRDPLFSQSELKVNASHLLEGDSHHNVDRSSAVSAQLVA